MKRVEDGLPSQKDFVLCDIGEDFLVPAVFYESMRRSADTSGFYHFSTFYHSNAEGPYKKARIENHHEIKGVRRWMPMPELTKELDLTPGDKVHYTPEHGPIQNGVVKAKNELVSNYAFVVYHCGGNWDDYQNYTGASTKISDLKPGWVNESTKYNDSLNDTYNEVVRYELDNIEADLDNIFTDEQEMEKSVVIRVIDGLRNTDDKMLLELDQVNLTHTFMYNMKANNGQRSLALQLSRLLNDKIQGLWDVSKRPTE